MLEYYGTVRRVGAARLTVFSRSRAAPAPPQYSSLIIHHSSLNRLLRYFLFTLLLFCAAGRQAWGQFFYFGENKIQYTRFTWEVMKTEHFDIYYYPEMKDLAARAAALAEESYRVLQDRFNHNVANRIPLILYSTHLHFEETNVASDFIPEGVGGFTEFVKGRVVIPYDGSMSDFHHVIRHELVHVFMYSKLNRVFFDHHMRADRLPPLWYVEGLAEYWSADWDDQAEMVMRDAVLSGYLAPVSDMDRIFGSFLMYKEGQNLLGFLAERFGDDKVLQLMENFWKSSSFDDDFRFTIGKSYKEFDEEWVYALKKKYYPLLAANDNPSAPGITRSLVREGFNSKPVYYKSGDQRDIYFIGNHTGYTSIMRVPAGGKNPQPETVIEGEKTDEFETFHLFQSKLDISKGGILAFVTKSGETDALHLFDVGKNEIVATYHLKGVIVIGSPSWSPDGRRIVLSAVGEDGNSDLYIWDNENKTLERLTDDIYDDRDPSWSPDGKRIVFSSDRSRFGERGHYNLFLYELATKQISYLTCEPGTCSSPVWSPDGKALLCTANRGGALNIWMMRFDSSGAFPRSMRRITALTTAAFDPCWVDSSLVFSAFENFSFQLRRIDGIDALYDSSTVIDTLDRTAPDLPWTPRRLSAKAEESAIKYKGEYSLDIAESEISTDPVFGTNGGAFLSLSDLLGDDQYYFLIYNTAQSQDEPLSSFNIAISRVSLAQRANYAYGVYRFDGRRYDITVDPDNYFYERDFGGYFALSYPLTKFQRIETSTSLTNSERELAIGLPSREALFLSNSISYVHDNSLWGPSGPLDGSRFMLTLSYTTDIQYSNANYYSVIFDYRNYWRLALRSAFAQRFWLFYNDGVEARRFFMGGSGTSAAIRCGQSGAASSGSPARSCDSRSSISSACASRSAA